jgi:hypothetical protein
MESIEHKIFTYNQLTNRSFNWQNHQFSEKKYWDIGYSYVNYVRRSDGYPTKSFRALVELTAQVAIWNKQYDMFFRGQTHDYKNKNDKSDIYPSICRPEIKPDGSYKASVKSITIETRLNNLHSFIKYVASTEKRPFRIKRSKTFVENDYALIQHYGILPTPMIDLTQSLRVAATFALRQSKTGYLYVFGLPYPHGSISYFIDNNIVLVKLQNSCPSNALRPRYQEGFLVGRFPFSPIKAIGDNLAIRMLAKFYLDNTDNQFWDNMFMPLPEEILFPKKDEKMTELGKKYQDFLKHNR